jgi:hypothetical protein
VSSTNGDHINLHIEQLMDQHLDAALRGGQGPIGARAVPAPARDARRPTGDSRIAREASDGGVMEARQVVRSTPSRLEDPGWGRNGTFESAETLSRQHRRQPGADGNEKNVRNEATH